MTSLAGNKARQNSKALHEIDETLLVPPELVEALMSNQYAVPVESPVTIPPSTNDVDPLVVGALDAI
jgi:hypothetical protein